jgi:hypothetical protein
VANNDRACECWQERKAREEQEKGKTKGWQREGKEEPHVAKKSPEKARRNRKIETPGEKVASISLRGLIWMGEALLLSAERCGKLSGL